MKKLMTAPPTRSTLSNAFTLSDFGENSDEAFEIDHVAPRMTNR